MAAKSALIVLAQGCGEIEAVVVIDVPRRAGIGVTVAGLEDRTITGSHGITLQADDLLRGLPETFDAIILPGGMPGARNLADSKELLDRIDRAFEARKIVAAICAAPAVVLGKTRVLTSKQATCFPGYEDQLGVGTAFSEAPVVKDGTVITSRAPGTAFDFALQLVADLAGPSEAVKLRKTMLIDK